MTPASSGGFSPTLAPDHRAVAPAPAGWSVRLELSPAPRWRFPALTAGCVRHPGVTLAQSPVRPRRPPARAPSGIESAAPGTPARPSCAASSRKGGGLVDATGGMAGTREGEYPLHRSFYEAAPRVNVADRLLPGSSLVTA